MSYDALDRLAGVVAGPAQGGNGSFAYDPLDNLRVLDQGSRQLRYHYDASNRLAQIKSPTGALLHSFGYDARGNTTSKDSGTLSFDRENRLTHSALPTATTYLYDGLGRRVAEASPVSTYFYYSHEGKLLYTNDHKTQANTDHIYLSGSLVAARKVAFGSNPTITVTYQHTDALGSPVAFTDASGNVTRRERMTAWGEPADGTWSNEPGYTGHQMDAGSKLVYMQQRYYDPAVGKFLNVDPVPALGNPVGMFNRYKYAANNPYRFIDPDGRLEDEPEKSDRRSMCRTKSCDTSSIGGGVRISGSRGSAGPGHGPTGSPGQSTPSSGNGSSGGSNSHSHEYRIRTALCSLAFAACTEAVAMVVVQPVAAPGIPPIRDGVNVLAFGNEIEHDADWGRSRLTNANREGHWFHEGTVVISFTRQNGYLYMETVGTGSNASWFNAAVNNGIGYAYFGALHVYAGEAMTRISMANFIINGD